MPERVGQGPMLIDKLYPIVIIMKGAVPSMVTT